MQNVPYVVYMYIMSYKNIYSSVRSSCMDKVIEATPSDAKY